MMFTDEELRLLAVYHCCSAAETAAVVRDALPDINEPDVCAAALSVIAKLESMGDKAIDILLPESRDCI